MQIDALINNKEIRNTTEWAVKEEATKKKPSTSVDAVQSWYAGSVPSTNPLQIGYEDEKEHLKDRNFIKNQAQTVQNQQTNHAEFLLSNITTEDQMQIEEEGYDLEKEDSKTIVTVVEKIKIAMMQGGDASLEDIAGLSIEEVERMTGNRGVAQSLLSQMKDCDLPITEEFLNDANQALDRMDQLQPIGKETAGYLVQNNQLPSIDQVYKAEYAVKTNDAPVAANENIEQLNQLVLKAYDQYQIEPSFSNVELGVWMVQENIPLTQQNATAMIAMTSQGMPQTAEEKAQVLVDGVISGRKPQDGIIIKEFSDYQKLCEVRKQLELETHRLKMSTNGGLELMKQGIEIDLQPIEETIHQLEDLKLTLEQRLAQIQGIDSFDQQEEAIVTNTMIRDMKTMPVYALMATQKVNWTLNELHETGLRLQSQFESAAESYETMMTRPSREYHDSIQKAFQNIDDILSDYDMDTTPANQRAVRILAYNQMPITAESIEKMKTTDESVRNVLEELTPKKVLGMIRENYNPLKVPFEELKEKLAEMEQRIPESDDQKFSEFLWKLDQTQDITQEERQAFVSIYRLIRQVEKTDGAAIGALYQAGEEVTLKNLMTQVRTGKARGFEKVVDENMGELQTTPVDSLSITQQIEQVYQLQCLKQAGKDLKPTILAEKNKTEDVMEWTPEQLANAMQQEEPLDQKYHAYKAEQYLKQQQQILPQTTEKELYGILKQFDIPDSQANIQALSQMLQNRNKLFQDLFVDTDVISKEDLEEMKEGIIKNFAEAVKTPEEMAEAQKKLAETAEHVMDQMIQSKPTDFEQYRQIQLYSRQIQLRTELSKKEFYEIPVLVGDQLTTVSLKIVRGEETKGLLDIAFDSKTLGKISAHIKVSKDGLIGEMEADSVEGQDSMEKILDQMNQSFENTEETIPTTKLYQVAKSFLEQLGKVSA